MSQVTYREKLYARVIVPSGNSTLMRGQGDVNEQDPICEFQISVFINNEA